jgi:hypothetical protein
MSKISLMNGDQADSKEHRANLETWLEDAIVDNFDLVFDGKYEFLARQYDTKDVGIMDILGFNKQSGVFIVVELKKEKETDVVVGQLSRYMGWVKNHIGQLVNEFEKARDGQRHKDVAGIIICGDTDTKLVYAVDAHSNITLYCYYCDPVSNLFWLGRVMRLARPVNQANRQGKLEIGSLENKADYKRLVNS